MDTKPTRTRDDAGGGRLSSVATAIALLKAFSEDEVEIGISLMAKRLGVAKSTAHRLATTTRPMRSRPRVSTRVRDDGTVEEAA